MGRCSIPKSEKSVRLTISIKQYLKDDLILIDNYSSKLHTKILEIIKENSEEIEEKKRNMKSKNN